MKEICANVDAAAKKADTLYEIVLRGDSTLRGHFPQEPFAVEAVLGPKDVWVISPFFEQGGRITINDVHYVKEGKNLVAAADTEFAKDAAFGYSKSNLREWALEKFRKNDSAISTFPFISISLNTIRESGPQGVADRIATVNKRQGSSLPTILVVNAVVTADMDVFVAGLALYRQQKVKSQQRTFLFRTAAAFVSSRLAIQSIPPLDKRTLKLEGKAGGLIIVGSYVPKSTAQYNALLKRRKGKLELVCIEVHALLGSSIDERRSIVESAARQASEAIARGIDTVIASSRQLVTHTEAKQSLAIGEIVSSTLVEIIKAITARPKYVIAKGGITSSDIATKALRFQRALIVGQANPGIPLWRCDQQSSLWPGIVYVVFPGNVGTEDGIAELVERYSS